MPLTEKEIDFLEQQIPEMAIRALSQAYWDTLSNGHSVTIAENGKLVEVFPDGSKKFIKNIAKRLTIDSKKPILIK